MSGSRRSAAASCPVGAVGCNQSGVLSLLRSGIPVSLGGASEHPFNGHADTSLSLLMTVKLISWGTGTYSPDRFPRFAVAVERSFNGGEPALFIVSHVAELPPIATQRGPVI